MGDFEISGKWIGVIVVAILILGYIGASVKLIDSTEIGVPVRLGVVQNEILTAGPHFVPAGIYKVVRFPTTVQEIHVGPNLARPFTSEGLEVGFDLSVFYRIDPTKAPWIYKTFKTTYPQKLQSIVLSDLREVVPHYTSEDLYKAETREKMRAELTQKLIQDFSKYGFTVVRVNIRNVELPPQIVKSIEAKIQAQQDAERYKYIVQKEQLEAQRKIIEAKGIAEANKIIGESLKEDPQYIQWYYMQVLKQFAESQNNAIILVPVPSSYYSGVNLTQPLSVPLIMDPTKGTIHVANVTSATNSTSG